MPVKAFALELKELSPEGRFEGLAATYNNTDQQGDVCLPGCFTNTLRSGTERPLLWAHSAPVGLVELTDSADGLVAKGTLSLGIQLGKDAYTLLKDGVVKGLSIGYQTVKEKLSGDVRQLVELKLFEVSLVTFPANEMATITSVKAVDQQIAIAVKSFRSEILAALE